VRPRRSAFRLVAATNRSVDMLKSDFLARFTHRITVPGLTERREDVPLLLAELLRRTARDTTIAAVLERRTVPWRAATRPIWSWVLGSVPHHVRLTAWYGWRSAAMPTTRVTPAVEAELQASAESEVDIAELDRDTIARALADHARSPTRTAKALGLKNRFVLLRLLKKHGLSVNHERGAGDE
jgi:two-component system nitrogen regulation response regulator GlnG/two-component system response regulator HydG